MTLRFFHRVATIITHHSSDSDPSSTSHQHYIFRRLCSTFQSLCICATAQRLTRGDFLNRSHVSGTEIPLVSHLSPSPPLSPSSQSETLPAETIPDQSLLLSTTPSATQHTPAESIDHIGFELFGDHAFDSTSPST